MSLTQQLLDLKASLDAFLATTKDKIVSRVVPTLLADDSQKLEGKTFAEVSAQAKGVVTAHAGLTNNPHTVTAAQAGAYSQTEITDKVNSLIPVGLLPLSRYGALSYLPAGVAGSFESGTTLLSPKDTAMALEDDGTLVYLRNGGNGSTRGAFYAYLKDALTTANLQPIKTNRRYQPTYFPAGTTAAYIINCSDSVVMGRLQDANGVLGDYFISLTNGTLDDREHVGAIITVAAWNNLGRGEAMVAGAFVYLFIPAGANQDPFDIAVYTIPVAAIQAGGNVTYTQVTGITVNGFSGTVTGQATIRLANKLSSYVAADKPLVLMETGTYLATNVFHYEIPYLVSAVAPDGKIRTKAIGMTYFNNATRACYTNITFSWVFDPATKTASLDPGFTTQSKVNDNGTTIVPSGPVFNTANYADGTAFPWNSYASNCYQGGPKLFQFRVGQIAGQQTLTRVDITNWTNKYEALKSFQNTVANMASVNVTANFGSAIGGQLVGPIPMSDTRMMISAVGLNKAGLIAEGLAFSDLEAAPTYTYQSIYNGSFSGYRPSAVRGTVADQGVDPNIFNAPVVEVSGATVKLSGARFMDGYRLSGKQVLNPDFTSSGAVSISQAALTKLKTLAIAALGIGSAKATYIEAVVPQNTVVKPFGLLTALLADNTACIWVVPFTITGGNAQAVTDLSLGTISPQFVIVGAGYGTGIPTIQNDIPLLGGVIIYEVANAFLIGLTPLPQTSVTGSSPNFSLRFKYNKTSGQFVFNQGFGANSFTLRHSTYHYYASPTLGFGQMRGVEATDFSDDLTKSVFAPIGTTEAQFDAWAGNPPQSSFKVLVSQDVSQGWVVYFTEATPVVLSGQAFTLLPTSLNLSTMFGAYANKTFYIYVKLIGGVAQYEISQTVQAESSVCMYIGKVITDATKITSINVNKVTRLDNYRVSNLPVGSAIPVSTGSPTDPDSLSWT
jgi:hypothetical protein